MIYGVIILVVKYSLPEFKHNKKSWATQKKVKIWQQYMETKKSLQMGDSQKIPRAFDTLLFGRLLDDLG